MKNDLTEVVVVIDRSGSMEPFWGDVQEGFNSFIGAQKKLDGECDLTLYSFDYEIEKLYDKTPIKDVDGLKGIIPRGTTSLYDAIGTCINEIGDRLSNTPDEEKPSKVIVAIFTDGAENSSKEFDSIKVKEMIKHQEEKYSWEFLFLASGFDAFQEAQNLNLQRGISTISSSNGHSASYDLLNTYTSLSRAGLTTSNVDFLQAEYDRIVVNKTK